MGARLPPLGLAAAWAVLAPVLAWALLPGLFAAQNPLEGLPGQQLRPPDAAHWFGTDGLGRDQLARVVYGARESLLGASLAVLVGFSAGTALGVLAGAAGGLPEAVVMRLVDTLLAIPSLLLSLSVIVLLGFGSVNAAVAVGIVSVAHFARLARAEVLRVRHADYVEAAFGSGGRFLAVLWRHVLPNALTSVLALAALQFGSAILALATLGFLGYGAPPPTPEWGLLIAEGRDFLGRAWWLTAAPGVVVILVVLAAERVSRSIGARL
ncbi:ABC transporter permease [Paracraurococcus lichenis]|uniref:ABC transporter permease n=1 Tax=Paracraurococcus lichenis TaxID=3064888 RepID=A0ABT9E5N4_9PROT|nr:ABC transporter permease [Paracraurococcus sp. LOR1-02]MDO9711474.1 ABC transporter permease [Paracraurococcus sp. LOR1-02]